MPQPDETLSTPWLQRGLALGLLVGSAFVLWGLVGRPVCGLWVWLAVAAAGVAYGLVRRPTWSLGLPAWCGVMGGAGALLLAWDEGAGGLSSSWPLVDGTLGLGFAALLLILAGAIVGSLKLLPAREAVRIVPLLLLAAAPWAVLAYLVLDGTGAAGMPWPIRTEPFPGGLFLVLLTFLVGLNGAAVGYGLRGRRLGFVAAIAAGTFLLLGVGFLLVRLGLGAETGRGLSFLLWAGLQLGAVWFLGLGHWIVLSMARSSPERECSAALAEAGGRSRGAGRVYALLAVSYAVLVVYGLMVPLEYRHRPFEEAVRTFADTPYLDLGVGNRADLVANLLLFIPLAFFAMGAMTREDRLPGRWLVAGVTVIGAGALSLVLEFLQLYFPPRTVSWNDVLAECIGAVVGAGLWLAVGGRLTRWWRRVLAAMRPADVARNLLTAYVVGFLVYQLFPFDVVLSAEELAMQADQGKMVLRPFADAVPGVVLAAKVLAFVPVGFWVVVCWRGVRRPVLAAAVMGTAYVAAVEVLQMFVFSRYSSGTDVVLGAAGALVGGALATRLGPAAKKALPQGLGWRAMGWLLRLGLASALGSAMVRGKWAPMDLRWPAQGIVAALAERLHVPFYYQYWNSEFEAVGQLLRDIATPAVLAMLLVSLFPAGLAGRRAAAAAIASAVAVVVELGQIAFPPHVPDMTTAVLAVGGAVAGVYLYGPFVRAFIHPGGPVEAEVNLEEPT